MESPCNFALSIHTGHVGEFVDGVSVWKPGLEKRVRTKFTTKQLRRMEEQLEKRQYIVGKEREQLARELRLDDIQVKVWFQNRRIKWRKRQREMGTNFKAISDMWRHSGDQIR